jgi:3-oxoacyl-[acyl-carrier protein] reductase
MKQVALITGGTRGIGLGIARQLALKGFDLALNGLRTEEKVQDVLDELRRTVSDKSGQGSLNEPMHNGPDGSHRNITDVIYCRGNLALTADRNRMWRQVLEHFGRLNLLVNNAGMAPRERRDILEATEESYQEVMDVNLKGPYFLTQKIAGYMIQEKQKHPEFRAAIINISSVSATLASVNRGEYCISKAGMGMMTRLFAVRLGQYDIPVYEVRPGVALTDMTSGVRKKYDQMIEEGLTLQKRWALPADVGRAVASLALGDLSYSTGQVIMVDGGMTLGRF